MLHAVIMAGGSGTRFWPASRAAYPKQLLDLTGGRTMIQATVDRLGDLVSADRIVIATNERLIDAIRQQLPDLPASAFLGEPCKRDTAPCIGLTAAMVSRNDPDATMLVMPADHVISTDEQFQNAMSYAARLVEQQPERIVTFGIRPTYPAETFGYIERGEAWNAAEVAEAETSPSTFRVQRFREKPDAKTAEEFLATGQFYWNAGIFLWKAKTILTALEKYEPQMYAHIEAIADSIGTAAYQETLNREFAAIEGTSIDYAVMERHEDRLVVEAAFQWDDVGNWRSLARMRGTDEQGNTIVGKHLGLNTKGSIIRSTDEHLIVTLGMEDCIVVHTKDATLVAKKDDEESLRKVVKMLQEKGWGEFL